MAEQKKINYIPIWEKGGQENFTLPSSEFDEDSIAGQIRFNDTTNTISWHTEEEEVNVLDITLDRFSPPINDISLNNKKIIELAEPENEDEATNKGYVDTLISGLETLITNLETFVNNLKLNELELPNGSVDFNSQKAIRVGTPTDSTDGANKGYIDGINTTLSNLITGLRSLNNLTSPTAINQDLIPDGNKNLGNSSNLWTIYTNGITNSTLTSPFLIDFTRTSNYPFLRNRRSDEQRGFSFGTDGFGLRMYICQDLLVIKQPSTEYSNIGLNTGNDVSIFGFNNLNNFIFTANAKVVFNPTTFSGHDSPAQVQLVTLNNNNMNSYFLYQCSTGTEYRGGMLLSTTQSNTSGNTSVKFSASGTGNHARFILANVQNNSPDTINAKSIESFGDSGNYTFGRNLAFGDSTNKGGFLLWLDKSSFNSNMGNGVIHWGSASTVPTGNPASNTVYEYVESGYKKIRYPSGYIVTI